MQAWRNADSRDHDRKSVWAMLAIGDTTDPCAKVCDARFLLLTRNTALVHIANDAWAKWLKGSTRHSQVHIEKWAPVAMSDKQFAGYLWLRDGGSDGAISKARLLAHCSAAVRPRSDIKARAYNLVLELSNRQEADDVVALLEDREGSRALMRVTRGDPEDVTKERLPYILEQVKLAAGEFAAARVREESQRELEAARAGHLSELEAARVGHLTELEVVQRAAIEAQALREAEAEQVRQALLQRDQDAQNLARHNAILQAQLEANSRSETARRERIFTDGFIAGKEVYIVLRWAAALIFGILSGAIVILANKEPSIAAIATVVLGVLGFWFVPDLLDRPMQMLAARRWRSTIISLDRSILLPERLPDFRQAEWRIADSPGMER